MSNVICFGIDPGKSGAMALFVLDDNKSIIRIITKPFDIDLYKNLICDYKEDKMFGVLEKVGAMPGQGVTSMFNFGHNFGLIEGMLISNQVPYELVPPQKWKKEFSVTKDKSTSINVCKKLFPNINLKRTDRSQKDDDGIAEAVLMAEYARRKM